MVRSADASVMMAREYQDDFTAEFAVATGVILKVERAQYFDEGDLPSWLAMVEGDWERAVALIEEMRDGFAEDNPGRLEFRRLRVVEEPLTRYPRWELVALQARAEVGERCRIVPARQVLRFEPVHPLPEMVIFGPQLMYAALYDELGRWQAGRRITDPEGIRPC